MAQRTFGIDFGTTNSLVSFIQDDGQVVALTAEDQMPHPSVVWYRATEVIVGRKARQHLDHGDEAISGDFVRSPKRLLAANSSVHIAGRSMDPCDVVSDVLKHLKKHAGQIDIPEVVDRAVFTIPVDLDGNGRRRLRKAARDAGISVVQFVHEPMAALYAYFRSQPDFQRKLSEMEGQRLLVFDWGGGTLDLTLCLIQSGRLIQIANRGDNDVGGDRFDDILRNLVREKHALEYGLEDITAQEAENVRVRLLTACETAKIDLSSSDRADILLRGYLRSQPGRDLALELSRQEVEEAVEHLANKGLTLIDRLLADVGMTLQDVSFCLPTGGMVKMPLVRNGLLQRFGARLKIIPNGDQIISEGAAWLAYDGADITLAKPIELLQPDQSYATLVSEDFILPVENQTIQIDHRMFYCVDPRDGVAQFEFARPATIGHSSPRGDRLTYARASLKVDPLARPLTERLEAHIEVDSDYVVSIAMTSKGRGDSVHVEIYDLEFSLALPRSDEVTHPDQTKTAGNSAQTREASNGVRLRSNVTVSEIAWGQVPGDIVDKYYTGWFDVRGVATEQQKAERYYYQPCATCRRSSFDCQWDGCDDPRCTPMLPSRAAAVERRSGL